MLSQRLDCVIAAGEVGFGARGVDFAVTDLVEKHGGAALAAAKFRDQVVLALRHVFGNRAQAEGADGVFHGVEFAR